MTRVRSVLPRSLALFSAASVVASGLIALPALPASAAAVAAAPGHTTLVSAVPKTETPDVQDGRVSAIYDAGQKIVAGGPFAKVRSPGDNTDIARANLFAFDEDTGVVDTAFAPTVDGEVTAIVGGPTAGTVYIAGRFTNVNGQNRSKVALLNVSDGSLVTTFKGPPINGLVSDIQLAGDRLLVAGNFTKISSTIDRGGLASLNAATGALDEYLTAKVAENHNWTPSTPNNARAPVGVDKLAVSPDGTQLVAIGNFKKVNDVTHDQVVKFDLGASAATIADWNTDRYVPACYALGFDSYVRDVAYSPDGNYFVVVASGAGFPGTLCDAAARFSSSATGPGQQPLWTAYTGGDTILSVAISEKAVYVGGHFRWINNDFATDTALPGAIARPSIAALDPASGTPLAWNPGRHPRGFGTTELLVTPQGLWLGYDQQWMGNKQWHHERLAFMPLAGGAAPHSTGTETLPGKVYLLGKAPPTNVLRRINAGGPTIIATDGGPNWESDLAEAPSSLHNAGSWAIAGRGMIANVQMPPIPAYVPRDIFGSERYQRATIPNMEWNIPAPKGMVVQIRLFFSHRCACAPNTHKFSIRIYGRTVLSNFDITASVGNEIGTMRAWNVTSNGNLDIDLVRVLKEPIINGIEIVQVSPAPPPFTGQENKVFSRTYDGNTAIGPKVEIANPTNYPWYGARGAFWVGGTLFYNLNNAMYRVPFNGTTFGTPQLVDPYHSSLWDSVITESGPVGQTYTGAVPYFYPAEVANATGMFYSAGRVFYTLAGQAPLFWRWFNPDSGALGATRFAAPSTVSLADSGGVFAAGNKLYMASRTTGNLMRMDWTGIAAAGTPTAVSGPTIDQQDWRAKAVFLGP